VLPALRGYAAPVSRGKRRRRPSGHPAKVAARRERDAARRARAHGGGSPEQIARQVCREAAALGSALEAEVWASGVLGALWRKRFSLPPGESDGYDLVLGGPLVDAVARVGGPGARIALDVIGRVGDGELAAMARERAQALTGEEAAPDWIAWVGDAEIVRAGVMREDVFDDGFTVFLEATHPDGERHAVGVYIDNNLGVMAKDLLLADSIDRVTVVMRENPDPHGELRMEPLEPGAAAGRLHAAMELTDMTWEPPLGEDYARLRALALLRADEIPGPHAAPDRAEVASEERDRLREEFLASPEGHGFRPDGDEAYAVSLAISFGADYVDGRPLRWSPVVVELFMTDWLPRKVMSDPGLLERLPDALDAWVRFAGRRRRMPDWAIERTREAIARWRPEMVERASDPTVGGPAKQLLAAAGEAGVDLADEDALQKFIAGWNARSNAS